MTKNTFFLAGMVSLALIFGFMVTGCAGSGETKKESASSAQRTQASKSPEEQRIETPFTEGDFEYIQNEDGKITITGYKGKERQGIRVNAVIPDQIQGIDVTEIEWGAFANGSFKQIGTFVPSNGETFETLTLPSKLKSIGGDAFRNRNIQKVTIPSSVTSIGTWAFAENKLSEIDLQGISVIGGGTFENNLLTEITLSPRTSYIGYSAFAGNRLTELVIPNQVTEIGGKAFANNLLTKLTLPDRVKIGEEAFTGNRLTELVIPDQVTEIKVGAFANNRITKLTLPAGLSVIKNGAFSHNQLKSVVLPPGLRTLGGGYSKTFDDVWAFSGNPLVYIKLTSPFKYEGGSDSLRDVNIPIVECDPSATVLFMRTAEVIKIGSNVTGNFEQNFANFYASQGKKAGIYIKKGTLWTTGTQAEFDALLAEKLK